ncbi:hypothetical protein JCM8547_008102 [Rhodosporidiobolus lusitaniae]
MAYPYPAVALLKYKPPPGSSGPQAFKFDKGDRLTVLGQADDEGDWLEGEIAGGGGKGVFPASFVERVEQQQGEEDRESAQAGVGEEAPLAAAVKQGVEQEEGDFSPEETKEEEQKEPSVPVKVEEDLQAKEEKEESAAPPPQVSSPPPPPPAAVEDKPTPTATSSAAPPAPSSSASSTTSPPPAAKKPSGLSARLAFFQQAAEASAPPPAPAPRPKPTAWKRPAVTSPPPPPAAASPPPAVEKPAPPPMVRSTSNVSEEGEGAGLSAADAQESIGRGGGSLKDRIAALQGLKMDKPEAPGRAPKPWRKKTEEAVPVEEEQTKKGEEKEEETEVKDEKPGQGHGHDLETVSAGVPGFEPAEATPREGTPAGEKDDEEEEEKGEEAVAAPFGTETGVAPSVGAEAAEEEEEADALSSAPVVEDKKDDEPSVAAFSSGEETITDSPAPPSAAPDASASLPAVSQPVAAAAGEENEQEPEDEEAVKRAAIAQRMAGLSGGQRMAVPMPALPRRTAGPRRGVGGAKKTTPAAAPPVEQVEDPVAKQPLPGQEGGPAPPQEGEGVTETEPTPAGGLGSGEKKQEHEQTREDSPLVPAEKREDVTQQEKEKTQQHELPPSPHQGDGEEVEELKEKLVDLKHEKEEKGLQTPAETPAATEASEKADVLASLGGAGGLMSRLGGDDEDEDEGEDGEGDGWDTPAPPSRPPPLRTVPPAFEGESPAMAEDEDDPVYAAARGNDSTENIPTQPAEYDDPPLAPGEEEFSAEELQQRADTDGEQEEKKNIAEEAVDALPDADNQDDLLVRPPETSAAEAPVDPDVKLPRDIAEDPSRPSVEIPSPQPHPPSSAPPPPIPLNRPRIPPPFVRQPTEQPSLPQSPAPTAPDEENDSQRFPLPTHPPPTDLPPVITASERAFILSQPEILSPPEEAFDESTAGVHLDAPSVGKIAEGHEERGEELTESEKPHPKDQREEGVATPAFEAPPGGGGGGLLGGRGASPNPIPATRAAEGGVIREKSVEADREAGVPSEEEEEDEEEEEEEDPEITRRRALAARMAKLSGGAGMGMGPMFGGLPPRPPVKKKKSVKKEKKEEGEGEKAELEEQVVDSRPPSENTNSHEISHPPRRLGGMPAGGFALPGMAAPRPPQPEPEEEQQQQHVEEDSPAPVEPEHIEDTVEAETEQQEEEEAPPLPPDRPSAGPPRRSVPIPPPEAREAEDEASYAHGEYDQHDQQQQHDEAEHAPHLVDEPSSLSQHDLDQAEREDEEQEGEMPPPPPPPRPAGGFGSSSPSFGPPSRSASQHDQHLTRSPTQSSSGNKRSSTLFSNVGEKLGFSSSPRGSVDLQRSASGSQSQHDQHLQQQQQENVAPPPAAAFTRSIPTLQSWSSTLGAQIFAAAHGLKASGARGMTDDAFVKHCFSKAPEAREPGTDGEGSYGVKVYEAMTEQGRKGVLVREDDEPRAGDILTVSAKIKHALSSKQVGTDANPHVAVVVGWDAKKGKVTVVEVGKKGEVEEGSYKVEDVKAGGLSVWRVAPKVE